MKLLLIVMGAVLLTGCASVAPPQNRYFLVDLQADSQRSTPVCEEFLQAVMNPDIRVWNKYALGNESPTIGEILFPWMRSGRFEAASRMQRDYQYLLLTGQVQANDLCERAGPQVWRSGQGSGPSPGGVSQDSLGTNSPPSVYSTQPGPPFLGTYTPNAYGPGINSDATGRPFIWQPDFGGPALGPIRPNVYGPGIGSDATGRPVRPACPPGWVGPC
jgi:hypothetical protein